MVTKVSRLAAMGVAQMAWLAVAGAQPAAPPANPALPISNLAQEHNKYALDLAERGAYFSAEEEYYKALWIVARTLDERHGTAAHSTALNAARRAFAETKDFASFLPDKADRDVRRHIVGHQTKLLRDSSQPISALLALQAYYTYASGQLVRAAGAESSASISLSGLAKIQPMLMATPQESTAPAKAIALYQAAIAVDPKNALAANELGVLLAKYGRLESARDAFTQSLSAEQHASSWHNLARVYDLLGQRELAAQVRERLSSLKDTEPTRDRHTAKIAWVETAAFVSRASYNDENSGHQDISSSGRSQPSEAEQPSILRTANNTDTTGIKRKTGLLRQLFEPLRKGRKPSQRQ